MIGPPVEPMNSLIHRYFFPLLTVWPPIAVSNGQRLLGFYNTSLRMPLAEHDNRFFTTSPSSVEEG